MVSAKQLSIAGTEPERNADIEDAAEEVRRARSDHKRSGERLAKANAILVQRCLAAKTARYEYTVDSERYRLDLSCPEPTVKLTFVGSEE